MAITVSPDDLLQAEEYLATYLTERVPDADFSPGSSVRDLCVTSIAHVFALLRYELRSVKARQSLKDLALLPADESVDEAVDSILSNWFVRRGGSQYARMVASLRFNANTPVTLYADTLWTHASGRLFKLADSVSIPANAFRLEVAADGLATNYVYDVVLTAVVPGAAGNVAAGTLTNAKAPTGLVLPASLIGAVSYAAATGGDDIETTAALLARAPNAISTRTLTNSRSIAHILMDAFDSVSQVLCVGYGDPEMQRDLVTENVSLLSLHTGGMADIYVKTPRVAKTSNSLTIGAAYPRPDNAIVVFRDTAVDFLSSGVQPGHVLNVTSNVDWDLRTYHIQTVRQHELEVVARTPFPKATDESTSAVELTYGIGRYSPSYDDIVTGTTGSTSRTVVTPNTVVLPTGACYRIRSVQVGDTVYSRVNGAPAEGQYQVVVPKTGYAQSTSSAVLVVFPAGTTGDAVITYDDVADLATVQATLSNAAERNITTDLLAKAFHPVYVSCAITYTQSPSVVAVSTADVQRAVQGYVEAGANLTVGDLIAHLTRTFDGISAIVPFTFNYSIHGPDGQLYSYESSDKLTVEASPATGAVFTGAADLRDAADRAALADCLLEPDLGALSIRLDAANGYLSNKLLGLGVSERTVRYLVDPSDVTVTVR